MAKILVVYATTDGHTAKVAREIGIALRKAGADAHVLKASGTLAGPEGFAGVIVAASVHAGRHQAGVRRWVQRHAAALANVPSAFVSVCLMVRDPAAAPALADGHGGHGHAAPAAPGHDAHGHDAHGHGGGHLHDAPKPMAFALVILAVGSILAGYVGIPHALGGSNAIEQYLEPSFVAHEEAAEGGAAAVAEHEAEAGHDAAAEESLELTLMGVSTAVALTGIGIAFFFFLKNRSAADGIAAQFSGLRNLLANKYYVDEAYDATIVQPIKLASEQGLWKGIDVGVIDGTVNGVAHSVGGASEVLRRLQTGSVRAYAASLFLGVVVSLGYYLWK